MKDRNQKAKALKYSVSKGWFPQLEVNVHPPKAIRKTVTLMTDIDVYASVPDDFYGYRNIVFDCKTGAKESAINRALWLRGVLDRMDAKQGICILRKNAIELDHRIVATKMGIILLAEGEFDLFARSTSKDYDKELGHVADIVAWEKLFELGEKYSNLKVVIDFTRSLYWMVDDTAEACRKTLAIIKEARSELDPAKDEHIAIVFDLASLFARALAVLTITIFKAYLHPQTQHDLQEAVKVLLYGGREAYEYRNSLYKLINKKNNEGDVVNSDLSLPDWERFINLFRQLLDAPFDVAQAPLILRDVAFSYLIGSDDRTFVKRLCMSSPQAGRFALLIAGYLFKAAKLPPEFLEESDKVLIPLLEIEK